MDEPTAEDAEYFPTPRWAIDRMMEVVRFRTELLIDPCVGEGAIPGAIDSWLPLSAWTTVDIRDVGATFTCDYLARDWPHHDACVMNPPFSKALQFAAKAMAHCSMVVMLQRLNWLATEDRADWMRANTPSVCVLPNRIDFTGGGGDSQEYAWFVWDGGPPIVSMLDSTPLRIRKEQKPAYQQKGESPQTDLWSLAGEDPQ